MTPDPASIALRVTVIAGTRYADDYTVIWRGLSIGRIMKGSGVPSQAPQWWWGCNVYGKPGASGNGTGVDLDDCKTAFKAAWGRIRAGLTDEDIDGPLSKKTDLISRAFVDKFYFVAARSFKHFPLADCDLVDLYQRLRTVTVSSCSLLGAGSDAFASLMPEEPRGPITSRRRSDALMRGALLLYGSGQFEDAQEVARGLASRETARAALERHAKRYPWGSRNNISERRRQD
jgi:hypothetical protein